MSKELKKLEEYNEQRKQLYWYSNLNTPELNGIACPECNEELFDTHPTITINSIPVKKDVHCGKCDFKGFRIA
jgi:hypothetical protein